MKKKFKVLVIACMALALLVGCGGKKPGPSRVDGANFTFTGDEFKNYFNDAIGMGSKIKDFKADKMKDFDKYMYTEIIDDVVIFGESDTENGKLTRVSVEFKGGKESTKGELQELKLNKGDMNTIKKYSSAAFDACEPNVDTKKFEEFIDKNLTNAIMLKDASEEIGDLKVSLNTKTSIEFIFEPKGSKKK